MPDERCPAERCLDKRCPDKRCPDKRCPDKRRLEQRRPEKRRLDGFRGGRSPLGERRGDKPMTATRSDPATDTRADPPQEFSISLTSDTRATLVVLLATCCAVTPLQALFTDSEWILGVWGAIALVLVPAAALRMRWRAHVAHVLPGLALCICYLTAAYLPAHALGGVIPGSAYRGDLAALGEDLGIYIRDTVAPSPSIPAAMFVISVVFAAVAVFSDAIAVVFREGALLAAPYLLDPDRQRLGAPRAGPLVELRPDRRRIPARPRRGLPQRPPSVGPGDGWPRSRATGARRRQQRAARRGRRHRGRAGVGGGPPVGRAQPTVQRRPQRVLVRIRFWWRYHARPVRVVEGATVTGRTGAAVRRERHQRSQPVLPAADRVGRLHRQPLAAGLRPADGTAACEQPDPPPRSR